MSPLKEGSCKTLGSLCSMKVVGPWDLLGCISQIEW